MYLCEAVMSALVVIDQSINQLWKTVKILCSVCPTLKKLSFWQPKSSECSPKSGNE